MLYKTRALSCFECGTRKVLFFAVFIAIDVDSIVTMAINISIDNVKTVLNIGRNH